MEKLLRKRQKSWKKSKHFIKPCILSSGAVSNETFDSFVSNIQIPTLSSDEKEINGLEECRDTLNTFSNGKSPHNRILKAIF